MKEQLDSAQRTEIKTYRQFDSVIRKKLNGRIKKRDWKSLLIGLIGGFLILSFLSFIFNDFITYFKNYHTENLYLLVFMGVFCTNIALSGIFSGYIAGNSRYGLLSGLSFFIIISLAIFLFYYNDFSNYLIIAPFVLITCEAAGYFGGLICEWRKLYPIRE